MDTLCQKDYQIFKLKHPKTYNGFSKKDEVEWTKIAMNQADDKLVGNSATHTVAIGATYWTLRCR